VGRAASDGTAAFSFSGETDAAGFLFVTPAPTRESPWVVPFGKEPFLSSNNR
jgi:hypothetical protein